MTPSTPTTPPAPAARLGRTPPFSAQPNFHFSVTYKGFNVSFHIFNLLSWCLGHFEDNAFVDPSRRPGRKPGASLCMRTCLSSSLSLVLHMFLSLAKGMAVRSSRPWGPVSYTPWANFSTDISNLDQHPVQCADGRAPPGLSLLHFLNPKLQTLNPKPSTRNPAPASRI